ncbi:hypothetical protein H8D91_01280 [archaeon]|nr:hypothetical protein [archaeon]
MKKSLIIASSLLILILLSSFLIFQKEEVGLTGKAIFTSPVTLNCTEASVKIIWDSYFKEESTGMTVFIEDLGNGACNYIAYKMVGTETFMIYSEKITLSNSLNTLVSRVFHFNLTQSAKNLINTLDTFEKLDDLYNTGAIFEETSYTSRIVNLNSNESAKQKAEESLKFNSLEFGPDQTTNDGLLCGNCYGYKNLQEIDGVAWAFVSADRAFELILHNQNVPQPCTQNWTSINTTCINDRKTTWFNDSNFCEDETGKPQNISFFCDTDSNGIIGNASTVSTSRIDLKVFIDNVELNLSKSYNLIKEVELKNNLSTVVQFNWNFVNPLNLADVTLKKQSTSEEFGWIIIEGLGANKTVYVDKKANTSQICIKDALVDSVNNDISFDCSDDDEYLLTCPDSSQGYTCTIVNNTFQVSGLMHSAVMEMANLTSTCSSSWICTDYGYCINSTETRTCTDKNSCTTKTNQPTLTRACNATNQSGNSINGTEVFLTNTDPLLETPEASTKKQYYLTLIFSSVGIFVLLAIGLIIFYLQKSNKKITPYSDFSSATQPPATQPPATQPPATQPSQNENKINSKEDSAPI